MLWRVGLLPHVPLILFPLRVEERVLGVLALWGTNLLRTDLMSLSTFATQIAIGRAERAAGTWTGSEPLSRRTAYSA